MPDSRTRRGGRELPPELQDRPEQNAGYDEAVRGSDTDTADNLGRDELHAVSTPDAIPVEDQDAPDTSAIDDREARGAEADVHRRERER
jgi:hypothetical protein